MHGRGAQSRVHCDALYHAAARELSLDVPPALVVARRGFRARARLRRPAALVPPPPLRRRVEGAEQPRGLGELGLGGLEHERQLGRCGRFSVGRALLVSAFRRVRVRLVVSVPVAGVLLRLLVFRNVRNVRNVRRFLVSALLLLRCVVLQHVHGVPRPNCQLHGDAQVLPAHAIRAAQRGGGAREPRRANLRAVASALAARRARHQRLHGPVGDGDGARVDPRARHGDIQPQILFSIQTLVSHALPVVSPSRRDSRRRDARGDVSAATVFRKRFRKTTPRVVQSVVDGNDGGESVQHRGSHVPLFRIRGSDREALARVAGRDALALHRVVPRVRRAKRRVRHGVVQEVEVVQKQNAAVRAREDSGREHRLARVRAALEIHRAQHRVLGRAEGDRQERRVADLGLDDRSVGRVRPEPRGPFVRVGVVRGAAHRLYAREERAQGARERGLARAMPSEEGDAAYARVHRGEHERHLRGLVVHHLRKRKNGLRERLLARSAGGRSRASRGRPSARRPRRTHPPRGGKSAMGRRGREAHVRFGDE